MCSFNKHSLSKSSQELLLCDLTKQLNNMDNTSPMFKSLVQRIEHIQYELHRARIMGPRTTTTTTTMHTTPHKEATMHIPTFSNNLEDRKQQYMEFLVHTGDHTVEEVAAMDMRTLRTHVDTYIPRTITVRTALPNGGTTTHYIVKKIA
jgi:hypothetical protein